MALQKCSECDAKVSSKAETCRHCGAPIDSPLNTTKTVLNLFVAVGTLIGCGLLIFGLLEMNKAF